MLTITQFADRTGISPSALRFYERKGLLLPASRLENGYRVYHPSQVAEAQLIHSLRQAEVSLLAIQQFLHADLDHRRSLLTEWSEATTSRLLTIAAAARYLSGLKPDQPQIHLLRWDEPSHMLWFPAAGEPAPLPFVGAVAHRTRQLERSGTPVLSGGYTRTIDLVDGRLVGEVGFRVAPTGRFHLPPDVRVEAVPAMLFATIECGVDDEKAAHRVFRFLAEFGYTPVGFTLERYLHGEADRYQLLVAVVPGS